MSSFLATYFRSSWHSSVSFCWFNAKTADLTNCRIYSKKQNENLWRLCWQILPVRLPLAFCFSHFDFSQTIPQKRWSHRPSHGPSHGKIGPFSASCSIQQIGAGNLGPRHSLTISPQISLSVLCAVKLTIRSLWFSDFVWVLHVAWIYFYNYSQEAKNKREYPFFFFFPL